MITPLGVYIIYILYLSFMSYIYHVCLIFIIYVLYLSCMSYIDHLCLYLTAYCERCFQSLNRRRFWVAACWAFTAYWMCLFYTLVFAGRAFVKKRRCFGVQHLHRDACGERRAGRLGSQDLSLSNTRATGEDKNTAKTTNVLHPKTVKTNCVVNTSESSLNRTKMSVTCHQYWIRAATRFGKVWDLIEVFSMSGKI